MIVFTTLHTDNYQPLADLTLEQNKRKYCEIHGYPLVVKTDGWVYERKAIGFDKVPLIREALEKYPECSWVFFSESDAMITNFKTKLEQFVDDRFHFILPADINGTNCGNFMIRNSTIGRAYLDSIEAASAIYKDHAMYENQYIQDSVTGTFWKSVIKVVPQRLFNSYDYDTLPRYPKPCKDALGIDGQWRQGDFIIHFADQTLGKRIDLYKKYKDLVVS
jgi:galactosyl transferase GMA12/MNN10 family